MSYHSEVGLIWSKPAVLHSEWHSWHCWMCLAFSYCLWGSCSKNTEAVCHSLLHKEGWTPKNWCFQIVVLERTLESPLDCKGIQPVHPKKDQSWVFIGRTDAEAETPILWPHDVKSWLTWKDPDAGKYWGQEEKGMTKDKMVEWHHQLNGHEFGWTPGVGDRQGGLAFCGSWGCKESDTTERLNWLKIYH